MNKLYTLIILVSIQTIAWAQTVDEVSVGAAYSQQAFYDLNTGTVTQLSNESWDIAFSNDGFQDAGIFINEAVTFMASGLELYSAQDIGWDENIDASLFDDQSPIFNPEENWTEGAFNTLKDPDSQLDYGWGTYNTQSHQVEGDQVFVIKKRDASFIKIMISSLSGGNYNFRYANLDGSNEIEATVAKDGESKMIYYSLENQEVVSIPTNYDLLFQRYSTPLDPGDGNLVDYTVTGVLLAPGVQAVKADGIDPATVEYEDYADGMSDNLKTIGHDWKSFSFSSGWLIDMDRVYFVKSQEEEIYKVTFFDFEGSSTGTTTVERTLIGTASSTEQIKIEDRINVYPNPTTESISINNAEQADIYILDISGRMVKEIKNYQKSKIDLTELTSGNYHVLVSNNGKVQSSMFNKL